MSILTSRARVAPSWGGQATGGAVGPRDDDRADSPQQPSIRRASSQTSVTGCPVGHLCSAKKKIGQKEPNIAGLERAINAGSIFCGAQEVLALFAVGDVYVSLCKKKRVCSI